jgi:hypothetical protein
LKISKISRKILEIVWDTRNLNKILESYEKDSRTFHYMDLALGKMRIIARKVWKILEAFRRWIIIFKNIFTSQY